MTEPSSWLLLLLFFFFRLLLPQFVLSRALRSNLFHWEQRRSGGGGGGGDISYLVDSTFRKIWAVPKRLIFWSSSMLMFPEIFSSYFPWPFLSRPSAPLATGTVSLETNINSTGNQKQNSRIVNKQLLRNYSHIEFMTSQIDHQ